MGVQFYRSLSCLSYSWTKPYIIASQFTPLSPVRPLVSNVTERITRRACLTRIGFRELGKRDGPCSPATGRFATTPWSNKK
jgi:hypothetical protein